LEREAGLGGKQDGLRWTMGHNSQSGIRILGGSGIKSTAAEAEVGAEAIARGMGEAEGHDGRAIGKRTTGGVMEHGIIEEVVVDEAVVVKDQGVVQDGAIIIIIIIIEKEVVLAAGGKYG
jgi:hypothetical protein